MYKATKPKKTKKQKMRYRSSELILASWVSVPYTLVILFKILCSVSRVLKVEHLTCLRRHLECNFCHPYFGEFWLNITVEWHMTSCHPHIIFWPPPCILVSSDDISLVAFLRTVSGHLIVLRVIVAGRAGYGADS